MGCTRLGQSAAPLVEGGQVPWGAICDRETVKSVTPRVVMAKKVLG